MSDVDKDTKVFEESKGKDGENSNNGFNDLPINEIVGEDALREADETAQRIKDAEKELGRELTEKELGRAYKGEPIEVEEAVEEASEEDSEEDSEIDEEESARLVALTQAIKDALPEIEEKIEKKAEELGRDLEDDDDEKIRKRIIKRVLKANNATEADYVSFLGETTHGGARANAGARAINNHVPEELSHLAEFCVASEDFCIMGGEFYHWKGFGWYKISKPNQLNPIANTMYRDRAGLFRTSQLTTKVGSVLDGYLRDLFSVRGNVKPRWGTWNFKDRFFDQYSNSNNAELRKVEKGDYFQHELNFTPNFDCVEAPKLFENFLNSAFLSKEEMVHYVYNVLAYLLFEKNTHQLLFHFFGKTGSGKGTLTRLIQALMGQQHCYPVDEEALAQGRSDQLCQAESKRLLLFPEFKYSPIKTLKRLSGGDPFNSRPLYGVPFEFTYYGHILLVSNESLSIKLDEAMLRRLQPIHFKEAPKKRDDKLDNKLAAIRPDIFGFLYNWWVKHVKGQPEWSMPKDVTNHIKGYRQQEGGIIEWITDNLVMDRDEKSSIKVAAMRKEYMAENNESDDQKTKNKIRQELVRKINSLGFTPDDDKGFYATRIVKNKPDNPDVAETTEQTGEESNEDKVSRLQKEAKDGLDAHQEIDNTPSFAGLSVGLDNENVDNDNADDEQDDEQDDVFV